jgi:hypothetical protein
MEVEKITKNNIGLSAFIIFSVIICIILLLGKFFYYFLFFIVVAIVIYFFVTKKSVENYSNNMDEYEFKDIDYKILDPTIFFQKIQNNDDFKMATPLYNPLEFVDYPSHFTPNYTESVLLGNIKPNNDINFA